MSTRGYYWFKDQHETVGVYKHHDGYPGGQHGGIAAIRKALALAWELPRFEADEFAASFVAANKAYSGGVRLKPGPSRDVEYTYVVSCVDRRLFIVVFDGPVEKERASSASAKPIFAGTLNRALAHFAVDDC